MFNLPWSLSTVDIKNLFGQCGTVTDVEIIKTKDGKSREFAFVTMASGEEAQAAIDKLDSHWIPDDMEFQSGDMPNYTTSDGSVKIQKNSEVRLKIIGTPVNATEICLRATFT
ncbi:hypothetical protein K1719_031350 [Acacia pycnantha]|nr:hypothetical protein K1719_031350 [Acacia pycnantha]